MTRISGDTVESVDITGPAEEGYLTSLNTFRRAQITLKAKTGTSRSSNSTARSPSNNLMTSQPPRIHHIGRVGSASETQSGTAPSPSFEALQLGSHDNDQATGFGAPLEDFPVDNSMLSNGSDIPWLSPRDHMRLSTDISDYLIWDGGGVGQWPFNYGDNSWKES